MSGIVGILNIDGAPVERRLLQRLTDFQAFRGPDAQQIWIDGHVGFGHTLLRATHESARETQPLTLDGKIWIVADARVDGRRDLIAHLADKGHDDLAGDAPDVELILRAYRAWGRDCVAHLLGDFAFAIWDAEQQLLFCARDQIGVKPFYFAHVGSCLVFSNTLDCIRQHPAVSGRLNDLAIADFLLFDMNQDAGTTAFADIQRLPAAHLLECKPESFSVRRYWSISVTEPVIFKHDSEYLECFRDLLDQAVADRLRTNSAGMLMSGGLDSTTVAAAARRLLPQNGNTSGLFAHTLVLSAVMPDVEHRYSGLAADALKIPIQFRAMEDCKLFDRASGPEYHSPAPEHLAWPDRTTDVLELILAKSRVALTGDGADPLLAGRITVHFRELLRNKQPLKVLIDAFRYLTAEGRFSRLYLRSRWRQLFGGPSPYVLYPTWLDKDRERELGLRERWTRYCIPDRRAVRRLESTSTAFRPEASLALFHVAWQNLLEGLDPGATRVPVEVRHPFFDLRLVTFLLGLPRLPWCCDKNLLREAARGVLPNRVRLRRKSPLRGDPTVALLQKPESAWVDHFDPVPELERYIRRGLIPTVYKEMNPGAAWVNLRPLSLNFWLRGNEKAV